MKHRHRLLLLVLLFAVLLGGMTASAMNTGFETRGLEREEKKSVLSNIDIAKLDAEPTRYGIDCFDVNENGMIAIGTSNFDQKYVCIYNAEGVFQYGYRFECAGSFGVELDTENVILYFVRSDIALEVTPSGEKVDAAEILNTVENNTYWNHSVNATERTVGGCKYIIKNDMGLLNLVASDYSRFVVVNEAGEETILYDIHSTQLPRMIVIVAFVCACFAAVVIVIALQFAAGIVIALQFKKLQNKSEG